MRPQSARAALALVSLALLAPSCAAAAENEDVAELRRMLRELQAQNRELSRRLGALESAREAPAAPRTKPARAQELPRPPTDISPSWLSRWRAEAKEHLTSAPTSAKLRRRSRRRAPLGPSRSRAIRREWGSSSA